MAYTFYSNLDNAEETEWFAYSRELGWDLRPGFRGEKRRFDSRGFVQADSAQIDSELGVKILFLGIPIPMV